MESGLIHHPLLFMHITDTKEGNLGLHTGDNPDSVIANRQRISEKISIPMERWVGMQQSHSAHVYQVNSDDAGRGAHTWDSAIPDTDALMTDQQNICLFALGADCPLVLLFYTERPCLAVVHSGWKGVEQNIVGVTIRAMRKVYGVRPSGLQMSISPAAEACCYVVGDDLIKHFQNIFTDIGHRMTGEGNKLDLKSVIRWQFIHEGGLNEHIYDSGICTICNHDYYSYRRQKKMAGRIGLFGMLR